MKYPLYIQYPIFVLKNNPPHEQDATIRALMHILVQSMVSLIVLILKQQLCTQGRNNYINNGLPNGVCDYGTLTSVFNCAPYGVTNDIINCIIIGDS